MNKVLVEVKLTSNNQLAHGYEKQLPIYLEAENPVFIKHDIPAIRYIFFWLKKPEKGFPLLSGLGHWG